jgi:polysaccharide chain length determinant protein (PEP-CTERM system associated)
VGEIHVLIRRYATASWRYRWATIAFAWVVSLLGWAGVMAIPSQYEASARVYVNADAVLTPLLRGIAADASVVNQLDLLQRTLMSRPNLEKLISQTDLDLQITGPADMESLEQRLDKNIHLNHATENLFTISYRNTNPRLAYDVVNTLLTIFVESKTGNNRSEMENATVFLDKQLADYEKQLRDAEKRRADFMAKYIDLLPSDNGISRLDAERSSLRQLEGQLADAVAKQDLISNQLSKTPATVPIGSPLAAAPGQAPQGPLVDPAVQQAQQTLAALRMRFTDKSPEVIAAKQQLEAIRATSTFQAPKPPTTGKTADGKNDDKNEVPNPIVEPLKLSLLQAQTQVAALQRQVQSAQQETAKLEAVARNVPELQAQFTNMNRDYEVLRKNYEELLARREEMRIGNAADTTANKIQLQIIDPPQVPQVPVAPNRPLLASGVFLLAIGGGIGIAVLLSQFDQSFHTLDDLRAFGLPVAGSISLLGTVSRWRQAGALALFSLGFVMLGVVYGGLIYHIITTTPGNA